MPHNHADTLSYLWKKLNNYTLFLVLLLTKRRNALTLLLEKLDKNTRLTFYRGELRSHDNFNRSQLAKRRMYYGFAYTTKQEECLE